MKYKIKLSAPYFFGNENKHLKECIKNKWISAAGRTTRIFENRIKRYTKSKYALGIINCTSALQLSVRLLSPEPEDEILTPSITFVSTINAVVYNNCKPIFMDCDKNFLIDTEKVIYFLKENTISKKGFCYNKKTKKRILGLILVHTFGNLVKINNKILSECKKRNIKIIEDAAESLGSFYIKNSKKVHPGTISDYGCLSFNGNKIITSGGGGMIIFKNKKNYKKAAYLSSQAKDDSTYFIHNEVGYNFRMSDLHSSIGLSQFNNLHKVLRKKKIIHNFYEKKINKIKGLKILKNPNYSNSNNWLNILIVEKDYGISKKKIIKKFNNHGIETRSVWYPNHLQKSFNTCQKYKITETFKLYEKSLCLPSSYSLKISDQKKIINLLVKKFKN
tara:strand:- start:465 stop:1634 length:1170 start_codon:yes stop_codon:yes gene_type:complete